MAPTWAPNTTCGSLPAHKAGNAHDIGARIWLPADAVSTKTDAIAFAHPTQGVPGGVAAVPETAGTSGAAPAACDSAALEGVAGAVPCRQRRWSAQLCTVLDRALHINRREAFALCPDCMDMSPCNVFGTLSCMHNMRVCLFVPGSPGLAPQKPQPSPLPGLTVAQPPDPPAWLRRPAAPAHLLPGPHQPCCCLRHRLAG